MVNVLQEIIVRTFTSCLLCCCRSFVARRRLGVRRWTTSPRSVASIRICDRLDQESVRLDQVSIVHAVLVVIFSHSIKNRFSRSFCGNFQTRSRIGELWGRRPHGFCGNFQSRSRIGVAWGRRPRGFCDNVCVLRAAYWKLVYAKVHVEVLPSEKDLVAWMLVCSCSGQFVFSWNAVSLFVRVFSNWACEQYCTTVYFMSKTSDILSLFVRFFFAIGLVSNTVLYYLPKTSDITEYFHHWLVYFKSVCYVEFCSQRLPFSARTR